MPDVEEFYSSLANKCSRNVPVWEKRIYSIKFEHGAEKWTATVGKKLSGVEIIRKGRGKQTREYNNLLSDNAIVLAIFNGAPYVVVTNHKLQKDVGSYWENPFIAGIPTSVTYFSTNEN